MLPNIPCCVNIRICQQKYFCTFLSPKTYALMVLTLHTKRDIRIATYAVKNHIIIQADESFVKDCMKGKERTKLYKNVYCVKQLLLFDAIPTFKNASGTAFLKSRYSSLSSTSDFARIICQQQTILISL